MPKTELVGMETARKNLGRRFEQAKETGLHTIVTRHGQADGALVDMDWYRRAREAMGEPTDL